MKFNIENKDNRNQQFMFISIKIRSEEMIKMKVLFLKLTLGKEWVLYKFHRKSLNKKIDKWDRYWIFGLLSILQIWDQTNDSFFKN